ncbi:MerR family transcriptional regulator [Nonomuraea sp. NPDC051941]|uniref:MerR family transcriptional regulator n=1 Tax=Nonomuraea sp. NPDC051941 TaxID=3364373 RepID=UPI0037C7B361
MLTIGELASYAGVTVRAVRHYHAKGLLPEPERDHSGYRRYDAGAVVELIKIRTLTGAGVPLARVRELLDGRSGVRLGAAGPPADRAAEGARLDGLDPARARGPTTPRGAAFPVTAGRAPAEIPVLEFVCLPRPWGRWRTGRRRRRWPCAGVGTLSTLARDGTSRNRAVRYWAATLPRPVRQGDPAGAAQEDFGQSKASTRGKSSSLTRLRSG